MDGGSGTSAPRSARSQQPPLSGQGPVSAEKLASFSAETGPCPLKGGCWLLAERGALVPDPPSISRLLHSSQCKGGYFVPSRPDWPAYSKGVLARFLYWPDALELTLSSP